MNVKIYLSFFILTFLLFEMKLCNSHLEHPTGPDSRLDYSKYKDPYFYPDRSVIVHLFEWKFKDIADECENFLSKKGFGGVQVSPVTENIIIPGRPWYERYQPLSYKIISRSGNEEEFRDMVHRCNNAKIRIYVDVVMNHMAANSNSPIGTGNSKADPNNKYYPDVGYTSDDFHKSCELKDYQNAEEVRNCELCGLHDLDQYNYNVRYKIITFINKLIDYGIAGIRVDAAKHMWPEDLKYIYSQLKNLNTKYFHEGSRPFIYQEVIDLGNEPIKSSEYTSYGVVTDFMYGLKLGVLFNGHGGNLKSLQSWGPSWGLLNDGDSLVFIDNHDNQRGHGAGGEDILTYKNAKFYKMAIAFMLAWPLGQPRIMSSYFFDDRNEGPPHNNGSIKNVEFNEDITCKNGWVCEHRWRQIFNMVGFHNTVKGTEVKDWWDNGNNQISFCRGNKGFIAFNFEMHPLKQSLKTCLPAGTYCDIISGQKNNDSCSGKSIHVGDDGYSYIELGNDEFDGVIAITSDSKLFISHQENQDYSKHKDPHFFPNRSVIVHLFEWKFKDIANECEKFLSKKGYGGVQVSPVTENIIIPGRPWYERYQPLSYKITTRSGNEDEFRDMVHRCNNAQIRIYVDVVMNHMTANSNSPIGTGNSKADPNNKYYPDVGYTSDDFHKSCELKNYQNAEEVRNCELCGLHDLDQSRDNVRRKIISFINKLIDYGIAGIRVDAAKHMWPEDLKYIYSQLKNLNTKYFPEGSRPFIYQEVIDLGNEPIKSSEYTSYGVVTDFMYGLKLGTLFNGHGGNLKSLQSWGPSWGLLNDGDSLVFIDNHDNQRGHGAGGEDILTYKNAKFYKMAIAFMLAWPLGQPRIMSSYFFDDRNEGPPHNNGSIKNVEFNEDITCKNGWVCEHRWRQIFNMVGFHNTVKGTEVKDWWDNGNNQISFCRGNKGFIAFNFEMNPLKQRLKTCLPAGTYCDVISGQKNNGSCSGKSVHVGDDGYSYIELGNDEFDGVIAISSDSKL